MTPHREDIEWALMNGVSQRAVAKRYRVARSTLQYFLKKNQLPQEMPYIPINEREQFDDSIHDVVEPIETPGHLTYVLYKIAVECYLESEGDFTALNTIIGAFDCAKEEFRRQHLNPYEDSKIAENGDVFDER